MVGEGKKGTACSIRSLLKTERQREMSAAMLQSAGGASSGTTTKKLRKPYTITRPRQRWAADEHGRFLRALLRFGRDWKKVEACVATKTATQIRSHAQKHFLRAQKMAMGVGVRAAAAAHQGVETVRLPLPPEDPMFGQVYRFVGDVFGSGAPRPVEAQLRRLMGADPVVVDTILRVLHNLQDNLSL